MSKNIFKLVIIFSFLINFSSYAGDKGFLLPANAGAYTGLNFNFHNPDFSFGDSESYYNDPVSTLSMHFGFLGNYPISSNFVASLRVGIHGMGMETSDYWTSDFNGFDFYSSLDNTLTYLEISPAIQIYNWDFINLPQLYFLAGFEMSIPIIAKYDFRYENVSADPPIVLNNIENHELPDVETRIALMLGVGYTFPMEHNLFLSPEVSFRLPFTDVSDNKDFEPWKVPQIRLGVTLTYGLDEIKAPEPIVESDFQAGFQEIRYYDKLGVSHPLDTIVVQETNYTEAHPILPYIFFEKNSDTFNPIAHVINPQTLGDNISAGEGIDSTYYTNSLTVNEMVFDIIGSRLQKNSDAKITVKGYIDEEVEKSTKLSLDRANFIKNFFVVNYGIAPERIHAIGAGQRPENASTSREEEGMEENRRVEIITSDKNILAPIVVTSEKQRIAEPNMIEIRPYVVTKDRIKNWFIELSQDGKIIHLFTGKGSPEPVQWIIYPNQLMPDEQEIDIEMTVITEDSKEAYAKEQVPVRFISRYQLEKARRPDKTIAKYSLVVFDFDSPNISERDQELIDSYILPTIENNSIVQVFGYTDEIGSDDHNMWLSKQRAINVMDYLQSKKKAHKFEAFGAGEKVNLFDNSTPVGRQLSRCVQIYVTTPTE